MIYVVETFQLSDEARADPSFGKWLHEFNALVREKNPAVESINVYAAYTGAFELEIWFGMQDFSALDRSAEAEKAMFEDPEVLGFAAYQEGQAVGVVEFLPVLLVPYPLPDKAPDLAFITCIYSTGDGPDYRGQVLERLVEHLQATGYRELQVVAGQRTPYPNGPAAFFRQHGLEPVGKVDQVTLREGQEVLVLLRRKI